ncbi:MAG TPA: sporulation protein YtfJ [Firmicutes bacterium]|nr:sporulation protein YtfJ [Bacillota bacterium]HHY98150.1 sporulation protein YtfJ [Bacillota bacterium]
MAEHPIEGLMKTAMQSIKEMVDVNTILGDPVETPDGNVILPVSRVSFGFAAGGTDFEAGGAAPEGQGDGEAASGASPFGGGSGAGISVSPVAFLIVGNGQVRLLPVDRNAIFDRLLDVAPQLLQQLQGNSGRRRELTRPNVQGTAQ